MADSKFKTGTADAAANCFNMMSCMSFLPMEVAANGYLIVFMMVWLMEYHASADSVSASHAMRERAAAAIRVIATKGDRVEKESTGDLKDAAKLMATSELNKEDLTEQEIYNILLK